MNRKTDCSLAAIFVKKMTSRFEELRTLVAPRFQDLICTLVLVLRHMLIIKNGQCCTSLLLINPHITCKTFFSEKDIFKFP